MAGKEPKYLVNILKAREYAFLGLYSNAVTHFESSFKEIEEVVSKSKNDKNISSEWKSLREELREEVEMCKKLQYSVSEGRTDYRGENSRRPEEERRKLI